jgi:hypothetical protein
MIHYRAGFSGRLFENKRVLMPEVRALSVRKMGHFDAATQPITTAWPRVSVA